MLSWVVLPAGRLFLATAGTRGDNTLGLTQVPGEMILTDERKEEEEKEIESGPYSDPERRRQRGFWIARRAFIIFLSLTFVLFGYFVLRSLVAPIVVGVLVAVLGFPIHRWVCKKLKDQELIGTALTVILLFSFVLVPFGLFSIVFLAQVQDVVAEMVQAEGPEGGLGAKLNETVEWVEQQINQYTEQDIDLREAGMNSLREAGTAIYKQLPNLLGSIGDIVFNFIVFMIVLFFLLLEGRRITDSLVELSPMRDIYDRQILSRLRGTVQAVFLGGLLTALVQGAIGIVAFLVVGAENALVWGVGVGVGSMIPVVGTAAVWVPAAIHYLIIGATSKGVIMLVFGMVIAYSDNILRPLFMKGRSALHPGILFVAVLGGLKTVGVMGLIYGPLIAAALMEVIRIYRSDFMISDEELSEPVPALAPSVPVEPSAEEKKAERTEAKESAGKTGKNGGSTKQDGEDSKS